ncbi:MAG: hypothetical protein NT113_24100 [Hyphomicrobiales bacterium]|nr:hypothetical protein [Hyphomicrobiales bacterium]
MLVAPLLGGLDALVVGVDLSGPGGACRGRQRARYFTVAAHQATEQGGRRGQTRPFGSRLPRNQKGLDFVEQGTIDDRRHIIFDDFGDVLAFAIALAVELIETANPCIGVARENLVDGSGAEQRAVPRTEAALVQPDRDLFRAERAGVSIAVPGEIEGANDDLGLDRFDRELFLLLVSDDLGIDGLVSEWNDATVGESTARVLFHGARCRA